MQNVIQSMSQASLAPKGQRNDTRLEEFMKVVGQLGRDAASGADSLPKLAISTMRAANDGIITTEKASKKDQDDVDRIYQHYINSQSKKAVFKHTTGGMQANASKLRAFAHLGAKTACDPIDVLEVRAVKLRQQMASTDVKLKAVYPGLVSVARAQLAADHDLTDEEIMAALAREGKADPKVEEVIDRARKLIEGLVTGKNGLRDQSEETLEAMYALRRRLGLEPPASNSEPADPAEPAEPAEGASSAPAPKKRGRKPKAAPTPAPAPEEDADTGTTPTPAPASDDLMYPGISDSPPQESGELARQRQESGELARQRQDFGGDEDGFVGEPLPEDDVGVDPAFDTHVEDVTFDDDELDPTRDL